MLAGVLLYRRATALPGPGHLAVLDERLRRLRLETAAVLRALGILRDAEKRGLIAPGGTVVEGTAGNTGIGLALVGNSRGYRTVITMPDTQSAEKKDALRLLGAELHEVPAVPLCAGVKSANRHRAAIRRTGRWRGECRRFASQFANQSAKRVARGTQSRG